MDNNNEEKSNNKSIVVIVALGLPFFFSNFHRSALGIIGSYIAIDYGLSAEQLGILGSALFYTYAAMQIPTGLLADRISAKKMLIVSCIMAAASSTWFAISKSFTGLVLARALTGLATAWVYVPAMTIIRKNFDDESFGTISGMLAAMGTAGNICAATPLKVMTDWIGWKKTFVIIGGISLLLAAVVCLYVDDIGTDKVKKISKHNINGLFSLGAVSIMLWFFFAAGSRLSFTTLWASKYFTRALMVSSNQSGIYLTVISIGCVLGSLVFGKLSDKFGSIQALLICSGVLSLTWFTYTFWSAESSVLLVSITNVILGMSGAGIFTTCFSCVRLFVDKDATGFAIGLFNFFAYLGSALVTQFSPVVMSISKGTVKNQFCILLIFFTLSTVITAVVIAIANRDRMKRS